jgi:hypothetical protein
MSDDDNERAPMTIKGVKTSVRKAIGTAARMADLSIADWLELAAADRIAKDAGTQILPPDATDKKPPGVFVRGHELASTADAAALLQAGAAWAAASANLPAYLRGAGNATLDVHLRTCRGLTVKPPRKTGFTRKQTAEVLGQTDRPALENGEATQ